MKKIEVYSSNFCPYCHRAKALLNAKNVAFEEYVVDMSPELRAEMRQRTGGVNTVPQIFVDGEGIGGSDDLYALDAKGELDSLLAVAS